MGCILSLRCPEKPIYDVYRREPLRLLGYAKPLGSLCESMLPRRLGNVPLMITTSYVCADIFHKTLKSSEAGEKQKKVIITTADAFLWQILATVLIPGFIYDKIKYYTLLQTRFRPQSCVPQPTLAKLLPASIRRPLPCIVGSLALPLVMYPVDKAVTMLMDSTFRELVKEEDPKKKKTRLQEEAKRRQEKEAKQRAKKI